MMDIAQTIDSLVRHLALLNTGQAAVALMFGVFVVTVAAMMIESTSSKVFAFKTAKLYASERQNLLKEMSRIMELNVAAMQQWSAEFRQLSAETQRSTGRIHDLLQATRFVQDQVVELAHNRDVESRLDGTSALDATGGLPASANAGQTVKVRSASTPRPARLDIPPVAPS